MRRIRTIPAIGRAALRQVVADLRPTLVGVGLAFVVLPVIATLLIGRTPVSSTTAFGTMFAASSVGVYGFLVVIQILSETYNDRLGGALLRLRILPHGPSTWMPGKTISVGGRAFVSQVILLVGVALLDRSGSLHPADIPLCLGLIVLSVFACTPLGFLAGVLARGTYSVMASYLAVMALVLTSGFALPLTELPSWVRTIHLVLPIYWSGQLTRWVLVGDPAWEVGGAFTPALAVGILVAWGVVGLALVPAVVRRSFRAESIGSLSRMQSTLRSQAGM